MTTGADLARFLSTDMGIDVITFTFDGFSVVPDDYKTVIADLLTTGRIGVSVGASLAPGTGAQYLPDKNVVLLPVGFSLTSSNDISLLVHEMTHAILDYRNVGWVSQNYGEAIAYIAEALFRSRYKLSIMSNRDLRRSAESVAGRILAGTPVVDAADCRMMRDAVAEDPHYKAKSDESMLPRFHIYDGIP